MLGGTRDSDGSLKVTVVDGTTIVGLYASDGSINVVQSDGTPNGIYHKSGARRVTVASSGQKGLAPDGSYYVSENGSAGQKVTVVSGAFV